MTKPHLLISLLVGLASAPAFATRPIGQPLPVDGDDMKPTVIAEEVTDSDQLAGLTIIGECGEDCLVLMGDSDSDNQVASLREVHVKAHEQHKCHQEGIASTYNTGNITADGERPHWNRLEAANRTLPFGTRVKVHNKRSGVTVVVRINDRGPFVGGRVIDLTPAAAHAIGMGDGLAPVSVDCI